MNAVNFSPSTLAKTMNRSAKCGVGDPHLLAVQDVVLAIGREHGLGAAFSASEPMVLSESA